MKLLAVTACPTGIAHTYMAAENLQKAADELGVEMKVETQGSIGAENELTAKEIEEADGIIISSSTNINKDRFVGKKLLVTGVEDGTRKPEELINRMLKGDVPVHQGDQGTAASSEETEGKKERQNPVYRHLMNGVSYMIPFIVVGGLLTALALTLSGGGIDVPEGTIWATIESLGGAAFTFMVPILSGFIAYSIADRPGLAPGLIGGLIADDGSFYGSEAGAGFLGGIVAGFLAGYVVLGIKKIKVPKAVQPVMPIIFIPILGTLIVGLIFIYVLGTPIAQIFETLTVWLQGMQGTSSVVLALILGAMISIDMGGPVNKVAFLFGSAMIAEGNFEIMGAVAAAICIPPIGMGIATFLNKRKYQSEDKEAGKATFTMGLFGITEGAIPFAAQDPIRVIPSIMTGSMVGAVIAMLGGVGDRVAHGGPIVAVLGAVDNVLMFFIAVIIGSFVTAFLVNFLKKTVEPEPALAAEGPAIEGEETNDLNETNTASTHVTTDNTAKETKEDEHKEINQLTDILDLNLIDIHLAGHTRDEVIDECIQTLNEQGILESPEIFTQAILDREKESTTGMGMNIAIPHGKSPAVKKPAVTFGIKPEGVDWYSLDGTTAKLIFMIAVPEERAGDDHLKILQMLSRKLMDESFREQLMQVTSKQEAYDLLETIQ
ncbi:MAG TPA: PTS fructose transporter subunit IIABC [Pseudogracilibacillus sp.]|nr:PTS fructose transporter subunit IIABC [Pseudogracilibacillus sp.]